MHSKRRPRGRWCGRGWRAREREIRVCVRCNLASVERTFVPWHGINRLLLERSSANFRRHPKPDPHTHTHTCARMAQQRVDSLRLSLGEPGELAHPAMLAAHHRINVYSDAAARMQSMRTQSGRRPQARWSQQVSVSTFRVGAERPMMI